MKILHIITTVDPRAGGPIEGIKQRYVPLIRLGHDVEVVSFDNPNAEFLSLPFLVHALGPSYLGYSYTSKLKPWLKLNLRRFDAVILNGLWQYNSSWMVAKMIKAYGIPYYVFTHGMLDPWFKKTYPLKHLKKMLYWPWGQYLTLKYADAVLFTSDEERLLARQSFSFYSCTEKVVNYGTAKPEGRVDEKVALFYSTYPELVSKRVLLFLSRIHKKKGCDLLIEAFAQIAYVDTNLHLVMAGPDQTGWQKDLMDLAEHLNVAHRITWTGMLSGDLKWGAYNIADAFILPSHQENFGIVVAEALSCGLPVLISNKVNIWREVEKYKAGFIEQDDINGCKKLFENWLALNNNQKQIMEKNAIKCFNECFEITNAAESLLAILQFN